MNDITPLYQAFRDIQGRQLGIKQAQGINDIVLEYERRQINDLRKLAYILATVYHETAGTMQPIEEYGKGKGKPYGKKLKYGKGPGKRIPYTTPDEIYYGRGHTQNSWYEIYDALSRAAIREGKNWNFLKNPELLLQVEPSIWATFHGMTTGIYTGKKLSDYINGDDVDYINARRIINGTDKAQLIAGYAEKFFTALS